MNFMFSFECSLRDLQNIYIYISICAKYTLDQHLLPPEGCHHVQFVLKLFEMCRFNCRVILMDKVNLINN